MKKGKIFIFPFIQFSRASFKNRRFFKKKTILQVIYAKFTGFKRESSIISGNIRLSFRLQLTQSIEYARKFLCILKTFLITRSG